MNYSIVPTAFLQRLEKQLNRLETIQSKQVWLSAKETGKTRNQLQHIRNTQPDRYRVANGTGKYEYLKDDPIP